MTSNTNCSCQVHDSHLYCNSWCKCISEIDSDDLYDALWLEMWLAPIRHCIDLEENCGGYIP